MKTLESDVVIIGAGIAGIVCAIQCLDSGKSVTLIDRDSEKNVGGLARLAFGGMALVDTPLQRKMGISDSPDIALKDWYSFANFAETDQWPKAWAEHYVNSTSELYDWLVNAGIKFFPAVNWVERGMQGDGNSLPRYHVIWGTGNRLVDVFLKQLHEHPNVSRLTTKFGLKVYDIDVMPDAKHCIAKSESNGEDISFRSQHLVIACGGITGSLDKVREHWHKPWGEPPREILNGSHQYADGLLHDKLKSKNVNVTHLDKMWNYAAGIPHPQPQYPDHGLSLIPCKSALWLDASGKRIGPEPLVTGFDTNELCRRVSKLAEPYTWQVLNWRIAAKEFAISGSEHNPSIRDRKLFAFLKEVLLGNHRLINQMKQESDHFIVADSLTDLVEQMNAVPGTQTIELETLSDEITQFDDMIRRGKSLWNDDQLRRIEQARNWRSDKVRTCKPRPILDKSGGPLIAIKLRLISRKSLGGIQTNLDSQVLDTDGNVVNGLYAIGEAAGFGGGGASGFKSLEGTFLSGCLLTARAAGAFIAAS